ncbi:uncharacterized protein MELLADRAFT_59333 [Melampsora larici-populina 98AG31]|uniref:Uncharacterized protein n=1 Tax=Melampsora larici-populina (strain 98AG31 / pathotype 3-4-7) TaxID=747676 RepID=F4R5X8_MELLP|nr:uncharacterized protein MELLADRAFT_59333 [Melampsora larici-populina 98AG31]EGG12116.1 hypothetical protein MELLADRAFT_59333 [Melampsora larici-populina 98AG31]
MTRLYIHLVLVARLWAVVTCPYQLSDPQQNLPQTPDFQSPRPPTSFLIHFDPDSLAAGEYSSIVVFGASWAGKEPVQCTLVVPINHASFLDCHHSPTDNAHRRPKKYAGTLRGPPYYQGRYSDGIIWAEYLSRSLLTGEKVPLLDYAYGGAVANNNLTYTDKPDTSTQLNQYISDVRNGSINRGNGHVLHFWWIGINQSTQIWTDAIKADSTLSIPGVLDKAFLRVDKEITELKRQVTKARQDLAVNKIPCDFFIIPIAPLETVLTFKSQASDLAKKSATLAGKYVQLIGKLSHRYNQGISRIVTEMQSSTDNPTPSGWVRTYDFESFWRDVIADPRQTLSHYACSAQSFNHENCSQDSLHPTTAMHKVIAESILSAIKD